MKTCAVSKSWAAQPTPLSHREYSGKPIAKGADRERTQTQKALSAFWRLLLNTERTPKADNKASRTEERPTAEEGLVLDLDPGDTT